MPVSDLHLRWFDRRGIDAETVAKAGVYSAARTQDGVVSDPNGNVIVFPFREHGVEVARKYRGPNKSFWQETGGRRTFWNSDAMDDEALTSGRHPLVITEGEIDALTALECGCPFVVSVPDGAPGVPTGRDPLDLEPLDQDAESTGKFEFMYNNRDRLKRIKRFVIAADADAPGKRLSAELVRRLSPSRCAFVTYPPERVVPDGEGGKRPCKDLNDVLMHLGRDAVLEVLNAAKPYPVRGLYRLSEYPEIEIETFVSGFDGWSNVLRIFPGEFMVVTGVPAHGKSTWVLNLLVNLSSIHGWRAALCSPEMPAVPILRDRLRNLLLGFSPNGYEKTEMARADAWIEERFVFIDTDPTGTGESDEPFDLDWIIDRATDAVLRDGIRVLVIDPWNEIEHARERNETTSEYIARGIRALKRFGRLYGVTVIVVAHPTKDIAIGGKYRKVTLYDIDGAAHWFNKCDHGIVVERPNKNVPEATIHIDKVRWQETGRYAKMAMAFEKDTGRFVPVSEAV